MSIYLNPVTEVEKQEKANIPYPTSFDNLKASNFGKLIVGVYDNGLYKAACLMINKESDFDWMENQYKRGLFVNREFYVVSNEFVERYKNG